MIQTNHFVFSFNESNQLHDDFIIQSQTNLPKGYTIKKLEEIKEIIDQKYHKLREILKTQQNYASKIVGSLSNLVRFFTKVEKDYSYEQDMLNKIMNMLNEDKLDSLAKNYELKKSLADLWNKSYEKNEYLIKMSELTQQFDKQIFSMKNLLFNNGFNNLSIYESVIKPSKQCFCHKKQKYQNDTKGKLEIRIYSAKFQSWILIFGNKNQVEQIVKQCKSLYNDTTVQRWALGYVDVEKKQQRELKNDQNQNQEGIVHLVYNGKYLDLCRDYQIMQNANFGMKDNDIIVMRYDDNFREVQFYNENNKQFAVSNYLLEETREYQFNVWLTKGYKIEMIKR